MSGIFHVRTLLGFILLIPLQILCQSEITLDPFANGLNRPVSIAHAGDDRLFVVEKSGTIQIIQTDGSINSQSFLDIRSRVDDSKSEKGLLGLAFHPNYTENGFFYVNYTNQTHTVISRYSVDENNPDRANVDSELVLITQSQPYDNHNAGDIQFGPDGYLYIGLGDGGSGGDPQNRSQNMTTLLGKMLRIDVNNGVLYQIPPDNPFADVVDILPEIWASGLRNPWRFSFDRATGEMYIADVGQNNWEEINVQPADSDGGENYGWRCYEGLEDYNQSQCGDITDVTYPVHVYEHSFSNGCSVTGGYVYRGSDEAFVGKYIYCDFCSGQFWMLERNENAEWENEEIGSFRNSEYSAFGEDVNGELYVAALFEGTVYKIIFPFVQGIEEASKLSFGLSPNPVKNNLSIQLPGHALVRMRVYNTMGVLVKGVQMSQQNDRLSMDISSLPTGIFYVSIVQDGKRRVQKFLKI